MNALRADIKRFRAASSCRGYEGMHQPGMSTAFKQRTIRVNLNGSEPSSDFGALPLWETGFLNQTYKELPFALFLMAI